MARPKLPIAQRKAVTITVRMKLDLNDGFAAVARLRGTTKSGLVSQYAAEQVRLEQEQDRSCFDAMVEEVRSRRSARQRGRLQLQRKERARDCLIVAAEQLPLTRHWCLQSRPHDRIFEPLYDAVKRPIQAGRASGVLLTGGNTKTCGHRASRSCGINLVPEYRE